MKNDLDEDSEIRRKADFSDNCDKATAMRVVIGTAINGRVHGSELVATVRPAYETDLN